MITGSTKNLGIIGWPIGHTLSPAMHMAAAKALGLDYTYIALPVPKGRLVPAIDGLRALYFRGWNVTIPHKSAIIQFLDSIDADAKIIGAVNTAVNDGGIITGYNTDVTGFLRSLVEAGFILDDTRAVVLGAGGAARAIVWALCKRRASSITIGVRNPEKAQVIAEDFSQFAEIDIYHWDSDEFKQQMGYADILINTTPLGMTPDVDSMPPIDINLLPEGALVYDVVYSPAKTKFLRTAEELGYPTINGEMMLVHQGVESFRLFTGVEPDEKIMLAALREALNSK